MSDSNMSAADVVAGHSPRCPGPMLTSFDVWIVILRIPVSEFPGQICDRSVERESASPDKIGENGRGVS